MIPYLFCNYVFIAHVLNEISKQPISNAQFSYNIIIQKVSSKAALYYAGVNVLYYTLVVPRGAIFKMMRLITENRAQRLSKEVKVEIG